MKFDSSMTHLDQSLLMREDWTSLHLPLLPILFGLLFLRHFDLVCVCHGASLVGDGDLRFFGLWVQICHCTCLQTRSAKLVPWSLGSMLPLHVSVESLRQSSLQALFLVPIRLLSGLKSSVNSHSPLATCCGRCGELCKESI